MNSHFDLQSRLDAVYAQYPEAGCQPVIGITGNYDDLTCKLGEGYYKSVLAAGGVPLIIPPIADTDTILNTLDRVDALLGQTVRFRYLASVVVSRHLLWHWVVA